MDVWKVMEARHSVRIYKDEKITATDREKIENKLAEINKKSGLHFYACYDDPTVFNGNKAHYGDFKRVKNYIVLKGPKHRAIDVGYYGEELVLFLQEIGINTCWIAITYRWNKVKSHDKYKKYLLIAMGYGENQGIKGSSKPLEKLSNITNESPDWFRKGMEAVALAPSTMHLQQFYFRLHENNVVEAVLVRGLFCKIDLGIGKYHFEVGAGKDNFTWKN